jgi:hypothetical protein
MGQPSSDGFTELLGAYKTVGGTARGEDVACLLKEHLRGDYVSLARLLVAGAVFGFDWRDTLWIPMFQFEPQDLELKRGPRQVLARLSGELDGWALAAWFTQANDGLDGRRPVDVLDADLPAVLRAARPW